MNDLLLLLLPRKFWIVDKYEEFAFYDITHFVCITKTFAV